MVKVIDDVVCNEDMEVMPRWRKAGRTERIYIYIYGEIKTVRGDWGQTRWHMGGRTHRRRCQSSTS